MNAEAHEPPRLTFRPRHRLRHALEFRAVYDRGEKRTRGPLTVFALPNNLPDPRLGLSVGRRVGTAPRRAAIKRRLREAFRHLQREHAAGYDLIVTVRPHAPMKTAEYQRLLSSAWAALHKAWSDRQQS